MKIDFIHYMSKLLSCFGLTISTGLFDDLIIVIEVYNVAKIHVVLLCAYYIGRYVYCIQNIIIICF